MYSLFSTLLLFFMMRIMKFVILESSSILPYTTVLSLATQSARYEQSMQSNLWKMADQATQATALQQKAAYSETLADESSTLAAENLKEGEALELQGEELLTKGEADAALAATDQSMAEELGVKAAVEEATAVSELGVAAGEEVLVEQDVVEATAEAAIAARDGFEADADQIVVGACQVVPILDFVCDIIGGVAAMGLETAAAEQAAAAAADYTAAVAVQIEEESQVAEATEVQAQSGSDGEVAAESQATASELEAKSQEELVQGKEEEATGDEKLEQSAAEQEASEEEQAEAVGEEEASAASWKKSLAFGASACWDAMMGGLVSLIALGFFGVRLLISFAAPGLKSVYVHVAPKIMKREQLSFFPAKTVSHVFHHVLIFGLVAGLFGNMFLVINQVAIRSRGGIFLEFGATAAFLQSLLLHSIPSVMLVPPKGQGLWYARLVTGVSMFLRCQLFLWPLFVLEILLLQVNFGSYVFSASVITFLQQWILWGLFAVTIMVHYVIIEGPEWKCNAAETIAEQDRGDSEVTGLLRDENTTSDVESRYGSASPSKEGVETSVDADINIDVRRVTVSEERPFWELLWKDLQRLKFPFELLVATSMFALLQQSIPNLKDLWPASKTIILAAHPHWYLALLGTAVVSILTLVVCLRMPTRENSPPGSSLGTF
jgi:flagellar motor protein MotB